MRGAVARRATADSRHLAFVSATWVVSAAFWPTRRVARDMSANVGDIANVVWFREVVIWHISSRYIPRFERGMYGSNRPVCDPYTKEYP